MNNVDNKSNNSWKVYCFLISIQVGDEKMIKCVYLIKDGRDQWTCFRLLASSPSNTRTSAWVEAARWWNVRQSRGFSAGTNPGYGFLCFFEVNQMCLNYEISLNSFEAQTRFLSLQFTSFLSIDYDYYKSLQTQSRSTNCWRRWTKQPRSDMSIWRLLLGRWLINWLNSMRNVRFPHFEAECFVLFNNLQFKILPKS